MDSKITLVFLTPCIHGHSNIQLTILRHLLSVKPLVVSRLNVHVISDEPLRPRLASLPPPAAHCTFTFHAMGTQDFLGDLQDMGWLKRPPPTLSNPSSLRVYRDFTCFVNREPTEHFSRYIKIVEVLEHVAPDIVVFDLIYFRLGTDACRKAGVDWVILSPGPTLDACALTQPQLRGLWYYPASMSNLPYPVPWSLIPKNIILNICFVTQILASPAAKKLRAAQDAAGLPRVPEGTDLGAQAVIHASLPEIEYPHVPGPGSVYAGPIFDRVAPVSTGTYPKLAEFLDGGRTVLINLGSLFTYTDDEVDEMATAIEMAREKLQDRGGLRALWKLPNMSSFDHVLKRHSTHGRQDILVQDWIDAPSFAVLQHPNLAASVHHGGANTLIENAYAGIPQVVLPMWTDLYTLAVRVETLGHGIYANRGYEPSFKAPLISDALVRILRDHPGEEGHRIRAKAQELAKACQAKEGDKIATDTILKAAMKKYDEIPYARR